MLLYFDEYGVLKEQLTYGEPGRVGDTEMQIFAYFDGVDVRDVYNAAFIRFQKPDINGSEYPALFLKLVDLTFNPNIQPSNYFSANGGSGPNGTYPCYLFDFSEITDTEGIVKLLDTPGLWRATLTLTSSSSYTANVTGTFTFNVESSAVSTDDETVITYDVIASNIANMVAVSKLNVNSTRYIRVYENFVVDATNGDLPACLFVDGSIVWDKTTNTMYLIDTTTENEEDANYVYATYHIIFVSDTPTVSDFTSKLNLNINSGANLKTGRMILTGNQLIIEIKTYGTANSIPVGDLITEYLSISSSLANNLTRFNGHKVSDSVTSGSSIVGYGTYNIYFNGTYSKGTVMLTSPAANQLNIYSPDDSGSVTLEPKSINIDIRIEINL